MMWMMEIAVSVLFLLLWGNEDNETYTNVYDFDE